MQTSILYYTNNLLPQKLFEHVLGEVVKQAKENECELIITSHFPITEEYEEFSLGETNYAKDINQNTGRFQVSDIYEYVNRNTQIDTSNINCKSFVVGKIPYSLESILKQIHFSLEKCRGKNIILMEHDCLYPKNYIKTVNHVLTNYQKEFTYCSFNTVFLNEHGYFNIPNKSFLLSGCAGKKELLKGLFQRKIELIKSKSPFTFEPILSVEPEAKKERYPQEIIIDKHICIDSFLGENNSILDIKHHLNADGYFRGEYYSDHALWGNAKQYKDMIDSVSVKHDKWNYGVAKLDY